MSPDIQPIYDKHGVAWCSEECPSNDGKRCKLLGFQPRGICEPWAIEFVGVLKAVEPFAALAKRIPGNWPEQCPLRIDWGPDAKGRLYEWLAYHGLDNNGNPVDCDAILPTIGQWRALTSGG